MYLRLVILYIQSELRYGNLQQWHGFLDFGLALALTGILLRPPHVENDHCTLPFHERFLELYKECIKQPERTRPISNKCD